MADPTYCRVELDDIITLARAVEDGHAEMRDLLYKLDQFKDRCVQRGKDIDILPDPPKPFVPEPPPTAKEVLEGVTGLPLPPDPVGDLGKMAAQTGKEVVDSIGDRVHDFKETVEETVEETAEMSGIKLSRNLKPYSPRSGDDHTPVRDAFRKIFSSSERCHPAGADEKPE